MTAAADLASIRTHWTDLQTMRTVATVQQWPPTSLRDYLNALEQADRDQYAAEARAERDERTADAPGERPVPINLAIVDTIRAVEAGLCGTADHLSAWEPHTLRYSEAWRGRWSPDTSWRHGVPWACTYLAGALAWLPGPQREQVAQAAREARHRVETALGSSRRRDVARRACPHCSGQLVLVHGGDDLPQASCTGCTRSWRGANLATLYAAMTTAA